MGSAFIFSIIRRVGKPSSVLIAGVSESGIALADTIVREHIAVLKVVGFVDDAPSVDHHLPAPLLGSTGNIASIIRENQIEFGCNRIAGKSGARS